MKLFGRSPERLVSALLKLHVHSIASIRCVFLFRQPLSLLFCYVKRQNPRDCQVRFRNGVVLHLSNDNSDIVTVYLIICRRDYGVIKAGTAIIDIGANIGIFSIYAALNKASSVHAYEPSEEFFALLQKNIYCNGFERIITPHRVVVVGRSSSPIMFPQNSSVYNRMLNDGRQDYDNCALVSAITFSEVVERLQVPNLVKIDCEGGEYDIILNTDPSVFKPIDEIRLEYHQGPKEQLFSALKTNGYSISFLENGKLAGTVWCPIL